ncbi:MAG TPA: hypothetical protein VGD65_11445 [Chryseosolibacter sp.]
MKTTEYIEDLKKFIELSSAEFGKVLKLHEGEAAKRRLRPTITEKLQYFDIITQRLQHLVDAHEQMAALHIDDIFKDSFLHLQYFQFSIIVFELFEVMSFVHMHAGDDVQPTQKNAAGYEGIEQLASASEKIRSTLKGSAANVRFVRLPALTSRQITICRQLYTMDRERMVLDWYVHNSKGELSELLNVYHVWLREYKNTAAELF